MALVWLKSSDGYWETNGMMRQRLKMVAAALIGIAVAAFLAYMLFLPRTIRIAVGPMGGGDIKVVVAFIQALQRENASIRLKLVLTEGSTGSAKAFETGKADLAVVRADVGLPEQSATVAVIRSDAVFFVTRAGSKISKISELRGKTVGAIAPRPANDRVLERILKHNGVEVSEINLVQEPLPDVLQAAHEGRLDAIFVIAPGSDRVSSLAFQAFPKIEGKSAELLPIPEADAIAEQFPSFSTVEIARGTFGGDPAHPAVTTSTLGVTHRLVARRTLDESVVSELTRLLFSLRLSIAAEAPAANQIELPSTEDRGAKLPVHAGTIAYVEGETKTFFERFGDWIYIGIMGFSLVGSVVAAFWSRITGARPPVDINAELRDIVSLIEDMRKVTTRAEFDDISLRADTVHAHLVRAMVANAPNADRIATIRFLLDELKDVSVKKRDLLMQDGGAPARIARI